MAADQYSISLLSLKDCPIQRSPPELIELLKAWRKKHTFDDTCSECKGKLQFPIVSYTVCCGQFYYDSGIPSYPVKSIAVPTPGYVFALPVLQKFMEQANLRCNQEFLILPDPLYWQVASTLVYEKVMKFVQGLPMTYRTHIVQPKSKVVDFYNDILEVPLNYGSLQRRSCGKTTLLRQVAFGKRCTLSMRGMIVPDASLRPNEIRLPTSIVQQFNVLHKWIILNRMPSLHPGNFVALYVSSPGWENDCFGIPLEIVQAMNADFDGDECNLYLVPNAASQAECAIILNPEVQLGSFVMQGPKLTPTQDMLVAYFLRFEHIDFLPYKHQDLSITFHVLYDLYGSEKTFSLIDRMRLFYLDVLQNNTCFALTLEEMETLFTWGRGSLQEFKQKDGDGCLLTQVKSGAKGTMEHLYQMFGSVGFQEGEYIHHSFWEGLNAFEAVVHAKTSTDALSKTCKIWEPGYSYSKMVFNLQGLYVDYKGRLMDGNTVIENDVLKALHHTDLMSEEGFLHLLETTLK